MQPAPQPSESIATPPVPDAPAVGPRIYGVVDVVRADRIAGWAIDRGDSRAALEIDIRREGRTVATARADRHRKDLERGGVGTGRYGFVCDLAPPVEPGFEFTVVAVARTADGVTAELRRPTATAADADRRLPERIFEELCQIRVLLDTWRPVGLAELGQRLELAQARIEASLDSLEPPAPPSLTGLKVLLGLSLATGIGSLVLGLWSMWQP